MGKAGTSENRTIVSGVLKTLYAVTVVAALVYAGIVVYKLAPPFAIARALGGFTRIEDYAVFLPYAGCAAYGVIGIILLLKWNFSRRIIP